MTLSEAVSKLHSLLPKLKANDAKFASDLIASFKKYGGLTPKQEPWIERLIVRAETPVAVAPVVAPVNVGGFSGVLALFNKAKEHLKFPKITLMCEGKKITLSLNGPKSKKPGFVSLSGEGKYPHRPFYGSVSPDGAYTPFKPSTATSEFLVTLTALLTEFSNNPARVAKDHGKLTGNCCFCNKVLGLGEDQRSVLVGFGPVCADHYGLKAEWLAAADKAKAKASVVACDSTGDDDSVLCTLASGHTGSHSYESDTIIQPLIVPEPPKVCFFCETETLQYALLHGHTVCPTCVKQLNSH